jgi:hypothetical protein
MKDAAELVGSAPSFSQWVRAPCLASDNRQEHDGTAVRNAPSGLDETLSALRDANKENRNHSNRKRSLQSAKTPTCSGFRIAVEQTVGALLQVCQ